MKEWIIIGGGLHGTHLAVRLLDAGFSRDSIVIVDPHPRLHARWDETTSNVGIQFLRSPIVHHVGVRSDALWRFAKTTQGSSLAEFLPPYQQPSYALFQSFSLETIHSSGLPSLHAPSYAKRILFGRQSVSVETLQGHTLEAERVALALGSMEKTAWPEWAIGLGPGAPICHIFDHGLQPPDVSRSRREVIVGGGLTAAQLALSRAHPGRRVTVLSRHPIRIHDFDVDPGWLGPRFTNEFVREPDLEKRRAAITRARFRGSMTKQVAKRIRQADPSILHYRQSVEVVNAAASPDGIRLELSDATAITADSIVLATGFYTGRPGGMLVDDLVGQVGLPVAPCGSPILDECLRWHPRLFLMGALAELTVGPPAKNISGARFATARILDSVQ